MTSMSGILAAEVESEHIPLLPSSISSVQGFPSLMVIKNGKQVKEYMGDRSLSDVISFAKKYMSPPASKKPQKQKEHKDKGSKKKK
jgi:thioredoxin-like negative regulator of GroEL